jgi:hypothetical protein
MKAIIVNTSLSLLVCGCALLAYDRLVIRPSQVVGLVDVAEIYRLKEAEYSALAAGTGEDERARASDVASRFARRLPEALEELPRDCRCLVVMKNVVAGPAPRTIDLTPMLKAKVGLK